MSSFDLMSTYSSISDQELLALMMTDDELAFNEIYKRYWSGIFVIARNRLPYHDDAEEVVQDIFYNLWRKRKNLVLKTNLKAYFAIAVKYEVINRIAHGKRKHSLAQQFSKDHTEEDLSTLHTLGLNELEEKLQQSVLLLPERCQLVFKLKFEKDYSQKEIADELGIAEKTVEAHLARARKQLKTDLGPAYAMYLTSTFFFF